MAMGQEDVASEFGALPVISRCHATDPIKFIEFQPKRRGAKPMGKAKVMDRMWRSLGFLGKMAVEEWRMHWHSPRGDLGHAGDIFPMGSDPSIDGLRKTQDKTRWRKYCFAHWGIKFAFRPPNLPSMGLSWCAAPAKINGWLDFQAKSAFFYKNFLQRCRKYP
jgi:hypothetical protein